VELRASRPGCFTPAKKTWYPLNRRRGGPQAVYRTVKCFSLVCDQTMISRASSPQPGHHNSYAINFPKHTIQNFGTKPQSRRHYIIRSYRCGNNITMNLSTILANDQLYAQIFNTFITILCMFRAISCSSSGGQILLTHCGRVTQICVFNTVKLGTSASSP